MTLSRRIEMILFVLLILLCAAAWHWQREVEAIIDPPPRVDYTAEARKVAEQEAARVARHKQEDERAVKTFNQYYEERERLSREIQEGRRKGK